MELKQLQYFVVSVDTGSLSRAANALFTTQPHISKTIKLLEQELGFSLLERASTGVQVTEKGKKVYEYARRMLSEQQKIVLLRQQENRRLIRLSSMPNGELARLLALYMQKSSALSVRFQDGALERVLHQVSHHQVELGFIFVSDYQSQALKNMLRHKRLEFHELKRAQLVLYAGSHNPCYARDCVGWVELKKLCFVQSREEDISLFSYVGHVRDNLLDPHHMRVTAEVSGDCALLQILRHTALGNIGCRLCAHSEPLDEVRAIRIEGAGAVQFGYVKRISHTVSDEERSFLTYLRDCLAKL